MKNRIERLRGMHDLLPEEYRQQRGVMERLGTLLSNAGYALIDTPIVEQSDLFQASFGQELWQNLYTFRLHHRDLCLRPEYTAAVCRLYLDHYWQQPLPLRFQYAGPIFRYEAPGRNRYRQHTQLGIELFGGQTVAADAEILLLACDILKELHIDHYRLELGHIGVASGFINRLHLDDQAARLLLGLMEQISRSEEGEQLAKARLEALYPANGSEDSPLGAFGAGTTGAGALSEMESRFITSLLGSITFADDAARNEVVERFLWRMGRGEQRQQILHALEFLRALHAISGSPPEVFEALRDLLGRYKLDAEPLTELENLVAFLEYCDIPRQQVILNLALGRSVSYYTGLVFEIHARGGDGFDVQLCGGGRYDQLMQAIGGREVKACGFAFGVERLLSVLSKDDLPDLPPKRMLIIPVSTREVFYALHVAHLLRMNEVQVEVDLTGHGTGAALKLAVEKNIRQVLTVGEGERRSNTVIVRDLKTGEERVLAVEALVRSL
ncbi:MAG TPA: HisS family protein [Ktedonobacteraceae bacterium]|jgi:ATP phosphoribosyltransferase regulatory subunit|nr:HisS family protein [Ktedonobacteraceae bacterium]